MKRKIAILLTSYNRVEKTIRCLTSVEHQQTDKEVSTEIYLVDDHSPDHTGSIVKKQFPQVKVLNGTGSLFWVGGMRMAWQEALKKEYDAFLLLNDDVELMPDAFNNLILTYQDHTANTGTAGIYIGSTFDPETKKVSYGGRILNNKITGATSLLEPHPTKPLFCDLAHANILLIAAAVVEKIGILSGSYTQRLADYDYTLTAHKEKIPLVICPGYAGSCSDDHGKNWLSSEFSLSKRIQYLKDPKHLAYNEYLHFMRKHFPVFLPVAFVKLWMKTLFPVIWSKLKS